MSGTISSISSLLDSSKIETANAHADAVAGRLATAEAALKAAADAVTSAQDAVRADVASAASGNSVDPAANQAALAAAQQKYDFQLSLVSELERQMAEAQSAKIKANGAAYAPVFNEGVQLRMQAAKQADDARASLEAAKELSAQGAAFIRSAWDGGYPRNGIDGAVLGLPPARPDRAHRREVRDAVEEAAIWGVTP